jgi:hypothetical protein
VDLRFEEHSSCLLFFHLENILVLENIQLVWFVDLRFKEHSSCLLFFHLENTLELENIRLWFRGLKSTLPAPLFSFGEHTCVGEYTARLLFFHLENILELENIQLVWFVVLRSREKLHTAGLVTAGLVCGSEF